MAEKDGGGVDVANGSPVPVHGMAERLRGIYLGKYVLYDVGWWNNQVKVHHCVLCESADGVILRHV